MATFAKASFNASVYSLSRPTYPTRLFNYIFAFHNQPEGSPSRVPRWDRAVDLGCGTGQATTELRRFRHVVGIDPSPGMLQKARAHTLNLAASKSEMVDAAQFEFLQGGAEDLTGCVKEDSVDLVIAAQACHWFDWYKVWPETRRILRRGGTAAYWVYTEFRLTQFPTLTPLITQYAQGTDPLTSLGPHFQRPGRTILERYLVDVPEPTAVLGDNGLGELIRVFFGADEDQKLPANGVLEPVILRRDMTWRELLGYLRTFSALHNYHEKFPDDMNAKEDTRFLDDDLASGVASNPDGARIDIRGGDIAIRFWKDLRQGALEASPTAKVGLNDVVEVKWPVALLLTRKLESTS